MRCRKSIKTFPQYKILPKIPLRLNRRWLAECPRLTTLKQPSWDSNLPRFCRNLQFFHLLQPRAFKERTHAWMRNKTFQRVDRRRISERLGIRIWSYFYARSLVARKDKRFDLTACGKSFSRSSSLMTIDEMWCSIPSRDRQLKLPGAIAEVRSFAAAQQKSFAKLKGDRPLHLFDTYKDSPPSSEADGGVHRVGNTPYTRFGQRVSPA